MDQQEAAAGATARRSKVLDKVTKGQGVRTQGSIWMRAYERGYIRARAAQKGDVRFLI